MGSGAFGYHPGVFQAMGAQQGLNLFYHAVIKIFDAFTMRLGYVGACQVSVFNSTPLQAQVYKADTCAPYSASQNPTLQLMVL